MSEQKLNIGGDIDLMKLEGAGIFKGKEGQLIYCVPVEKAKLNHYTRENGVVSLFLNFFGLSRDDAHGNNFMLKRALTKKESEYNKTVPNEQKISGEILGNAKFLTPNYTPAQPTTTASDVFGEEENPDLPF